MAILRFVDSISASPSVRLDLNATSFATWTMAPDTAFPPPPMKRSLTGTMLRDGEYMGASAYGNREIRLVLNLMPGSADTAATQLQLLHKELDRNANILEYRPGGATSSVFFRTYRSSPDSVQFDPNRKKIEISLLAEPFALGLRVDVGTVTVNQDPAAGSNGCFYDVTSVKGDVETPLLLTYGALSNGGGGFGFPSTNVAVRTGGVYPTLFRQAESLSLGTDTTSTADATMSGGNRATISFATNNTLTVPRLSGTFPTGTVPAGSENRGFYRVFLRVRTVAAVQTFSASMDLGATSVSFTASPSPSIVEVGTWSVLNAQPPAVGFESSALGVSFLPTMSLYFSRATASESLYVDWVMLIPADYRYGTFEGVAANATGDLSVLDGPNDAFYATATVPFTTPRLAREFTPARTGGMPTVKPGDNRVYILHTSKVGSGGILITDTLSVSAYYWPRYVHVRPATT